MSVELELFLEARRDFWSRAGSRLLPVAKSPQRLPGGGKHGTVTLESLITGVCRAPILAPIRLNIGQTPWRLVGLVI